MEVHGDKDKEADNVDDLEILNEGEESGRR